MTRQAIVTKYHGPAYRRGSRIIARARKASDAGFSLAESVDDSLGIQERHLKVAQALANRLRWLGVYVAGHTLDDTGYVYVNAGGALCADRLKLRDALLAAGQVQGSDFFVVEGD